MLRNKLKEITQNSLPELKSKSLENVNNLSDGVLKNLDEIRYMTPEQLHDKFELNLDLNLQTEELDIQNEFTIKDITEEDKLTMKEVSGWSSKIIDAIGSWEEYEIYEAADLDEAEIDNRACLIRNDIDWNQKDTMGRTNSERAEQGLAPLNKNGKIIELHHIGQHCDSPLAELTLDEHRGKGNDTILHNKTKESEINRQAFATERSKHWIARS